MATLAPDRSASQEQERSRPSQRRIAPGFTAALLAFLIGVPLAWAALLLFHPVGDGVIYTSLRDDVTAWQIVHAGTFVFIGLMGVALYLLVRDLPGRAAAVSRLAIAPFVLCYGAYEAVIGLATGALVQHGNAVPLSERAAVSNTIESLQDNVIIGDPGIVGSLGVLAWTVAVIAAVVALKRAGAPAAALVLLGVSVVVVSHPPPIGPIGLAAFAGAVGVLALSKRRSAATEAATRPAAPRPT
jgi:hypothetical protein